MSLLMEALKRAEQEKKKAMEGSLEDISPAIPNRSPDDLGLEPVSEETSKDAPLPARSATTEEHSAPAAAFDPIQSPDLEGSDLGKSAPSTFADASPCGSQPIPSSPPLDAHLCRSPSS